jgi:hypothetical protein
MEYLFLRSREFALNEIARLKERLEEVREWSSTRSSSSSSPSSS